MTVQEMLLRKILKGDESDNIPSLVGNMQEKEIIELIQNNDKFEEWLNKDKHRKLYENNQILIDFNYIPSDLKDKILHECNDIIYGL